MVKNFRDKFWNDLNREFDDINSQFKDLLKILHVDDPQEVNMGSSVGDFGATPHFLVAYQRSSGRLIEVRQFLNKDK
ncbi:MAG: hypothetical protein JW841_11175 [Deltaproteobacteria bacterium]|nr:hypothetical protein [Deltaproteobacteria bacterium]